MRVADQFAFNLAILLVSGGASLGALMPSPALSQTATGATTTTELSEVVVTGTRAALVESLDRKRGAKIVQDSIVAEDLGRFPDDNVADSLSHITGVTIQRTRGGEGQYVNVRGLGPEFSIVTLNGRILATDGDGREFAFDVLPSEVISGADVLKSSEAPISKAASAARSICAPRDRSTASASACRSRSKATTTTCPKTAATR